MTFKECISVSWRGTTAINKDSKTMVISFNKKNDADEIIRLEIVVDCAKKLSETLSKYLSKYKAKGDSNA